MSRPQSDKHVRLLLHSMASPDFTPNKKSHLGTGWLFLLGKGRWRQTIGMAEMVHTDLADLP